MFQALPWCSQLDKMKTKFSVNWYSHTWLIECKLWKNKYAFCTSNSSLPYSISVSKPWNNVVGNSEGEFETVTASVFKTKCISLGIWHKRDWQNKIRAIRSYNCKALNLHFWLSNICSFYSMNKQTSFSSLVILKIPNYYHQTPTLTWCNWSY